MTRCDYCDEPICEECGCCTECGDGCRCGGPTDQQLEDVAHYGYAEPFTMFDKDDPR